ncbi:MAG TPA: SRPBCC domain-containing protein [Coleofasciculaceae cyanobacterium]
MSGRNPMSGGNPMSQAVDLDVFYPYPPERVWQVLTDRRALATWMMENNFEPKLGHKFQFYSQLLPGLTTTIQCEVVELQAPTRLVYTWRESTTEPSLVIWTLTPVAGGTQLRLKHHQYSYTTAASSFAGVEHAVDQIDRSARLFLREPSPNSRILDGAAPGSGWRYANQPLLADVITALDAPQTVAWDYFLNQQLAIALMQDESAR